MTSSRCILIAIAGGSASGKKSVQTALTTCLLSLQSTPNTFNVETLHQSDFHLPSAKDAKHDPEHIDAYDLPALSEVIARVRGGEAGVSSPQLDSPGTEPRLLAHRPDVLIVEGTYVLCHARIASMADVKVFIDCDADVRLARRAVRDFEERGIPLDAIFEQHVRYSKTAYSQLILPTKQSADIILPGGGAGGGAGVNVAGVELIANGVMDELKGCGKGVGSVGNGFLAEGDLLSAGLPSYYETV